MATTHPLLRRVGIACAGTALAAGLVAGVGSVANASPIVGAVATVSPNAAASGPTSPSASPSGSPSASPSTKPARGSLRALVKAMPKSLRQDVAKLRKDSPADRKKAVAAIEQKALSGGYGAEVQSIATKVKSDWSSAPDSFKHAVAGLREGTGYERAAQLRMIDRRALAGKYGTAIQQDAQAIESALAATGSSAGS